MSSSLSSPSNSQRAGSFWCPTTIDSEVTLP
ncbi:hypothetical protein CsSME_00030228 [Camellia sinensis var. sinensis]